MDAIKENVEVIIVAIIIALGIRAYFLQPFKIPTASMQPTLNGIIGNPMGKDEAFPNPVKQGVDFVWRGSNYTELKSPASSGQIFITRIVQKSLAMFFTRTSVEFSDGSSTTCYGPARQLFKDLWLDDEKPSQKAIRDRGVVADLPTEDFDKAGLRLPVPAGKVLARGSIDTGDQLLVDKMSYHFRRPTRGEVFVFNTKDIPGIVAPPGADSQHYIKRLVGVPNDKLAVVAPTLYVNGKPAEEPGIVRVMSHEGNPNLDPNINKYHGYTNAGTASQADVTQGQVEINGQMWTEYQLQDKQYFALGDNSGNSADSRYWGKVPERGVVGRALVVYWPFSPHWGLIR
jgi:signal peptidase I